mmetsp:Transcript_144288/g.462139  ORF Transcript_144288/g.462139 Transcript_144288/m.462139 type:complete len:153 (-) Transcript_144288:192-650(-)
MPLSSSVAEDAGGPSSIGLGLVEEQGGAAPAAEEPLMVCAKSPRGNTDVSRFNELEQVDELCSTNGSIAASLVDVDDPEVLFRKEKKSPRSRSNQVDQQPIGIKSDVPLYPAQASKKPAHILELGFFACCSSVCSELFAQEGQPKIRNCVFL